MRVLIVEDDWFIATALSRSLADRGLAVVGVTGEGCEALRIADAEKPEVAFVDIRLADAISGTTVGDHLAMQGVAVIYLTGHVEQALREGRAHAVDILPKPYTEAELIMALTRAGHHRPSGA